MATGNIPASMMKPIPRRMTANITSVKVKPRRKRSGFEDVGLFICISFASNQGAVVAVDDQGDGIPVDPVFLSLLGAGVGGESGAGDVVKSAATGLGVGVGEILAVERFRIEKNQAKSGL